MADSLGPQGTLVTVHQSTAHYSSSILETHAVHMRLHYLDKLRCIYFTRVSAHTGFVTGIKQRPLPQLVTSHEIAISVGPHGTLVTGIKSELVTMKLTSETRSVNLRLLWIDEMRRICFYARLLSLV
jgi:hypothetical protein